MKKFEIPEQYRSGIIGELKRRRRISDPRKQNFSPGVLRFGNVDIILPRHFGFCYGVENAIETSYKAIKENPGKRLFLLSEMIHNPVVNADLQENGIRFIMDTHGQQILSWEEITPEDIVIIPAFGTTVEIENLLIEKGVEIQKYNTTCPFVEKVWKRSSEIGKKGFSIIIHGKHKHEETRATFSHSYQNAPSIIIRDMKEAELLASFMQEEKTEAEFLSLFGDRISENFNFKKDLQRIGVVNQTTMLATETQDIADFFKKIKIKEHDENHLDYFADTRDTLCYATNDNQESTLQVLKKGADLALVIGGYNSSNTSQIVAILQQKMATYFIQDEKEIQSLEVIQHFDYPTHQLLNTTHWLPEKRPIQIVLTSGASCPDTILESVLLRILELIPPEKELSEAIHEFDQGSKSQEP
jgi:4-hydroxy-3-methylbut-2-enyl diphosphate reductase